VNILFVLSATFYVFSMLFIFSYALSQVHLLIQYKSKNSKKVNSDQQELQYFPSVTIQLPIYNERFVVERLIDSVCKINYPNEKLQIQVLDDSTDDSSTITLEKIKEWRKKGVDIVWEHRVDRSGFKAGALKKGLNDAKGELIAIFDSDFIPNEDFLLNTVRHFKDPKVGVVQTRWEHINREESILTKIQALALDAHFTIEQGGRNHYGAFINFNGTAGIWRKSCILDAGNWEADTLTEDLDLSYRAQLKGWKFIYKEAIGSPAELPSIMSAVKSQQYRWNKGGAEVARKALPTLFQSNFPFSVKMHGMFHLLNSSVFVAVLVAGISSFPLAHYISINTEWQGMLRIGILFLILTAVLGINFYTGFKKCGNGNLLGFLIQFPVFLCMSMGLAVHNSIAVLEGLAGKKTPFIRTPKAGNTLLGQNSYFKSEISESTWIELSLGWYFTFAIVWGVLNGFYAFLLFHAMLAIGFFSIAGITILHDLKLRKALIKYSTHPNSN